MARSLKAAQPRSATSSAAVEETAAAIIAAVRTGGDDAVREWSQKLDGSSPPSFLLTDKELSEIVRGLPTTVVEDLEYVQKQVWHFRRCQLDSLHDFEVEVSPGVRLGQRNIPVAATGAYIPGGRYALTASAHMTIVTAKAAGVGRVAACTPPIRGELPLVTLAAMHIGGADEAYVLGGVQAVAALALGTETIARVDLLTGPGMLSYPRPSANFLARWASTSWPAPQRSLSYPTKKPTPLLWPWTCSARPSTGPTRRPSW